MAGKDHNPRALHYATPPLRVLPSIRSSERRRAPPKHSPHPCLRRVNVTRRSDGHCPARAIVAASPASVSLPQQVLVQRVVEDVLLRAPGLEGI